MGGSDADRRRWEPLHVLAALKAARDFGLDGQAAAGVASRVDPRAHGYEAFIDALADALLDGGAVQVPEFA